MTYREKIEQEQPNRLDSTCLGGVAGCPGSYWSGTPYLGNGGCKYGAGPDRCSKCWDTEIPKTKLTKNTKDEKEKKEMANVNINETIANPTEGRKSSLCEDLMRLYKTLAEIEHMTSGLGEVLFGLPRAEVAVCDPDCIESNIHLANEMAKMIREELFAIHDRLH